MRKTPSANLWSHGQMDRHVPSLPMDMYTVHIHTQLYFRFYNTLAKI